MENAHIVSALVSKIAHIQGEIESHYKAIKGLEVKANTLKQSLLIFDENFDLRSIKAIRHRNALFKPRELKRLVVEALKQRQSVNLNEIVKIIAHNKRLDNKAIYDDILARCLQNNSISNEFCGYWQDNKRVYERLRR